MKTITRDNLTIIIGDTAVPTQRTAKRTLGMQTILIVRPRGDKMNGEAYYKTQRHILSKGQGYNLTAVENLRHSLGAMAQNELLKDGFSLLIEEGTVKKLTPDDFAAAVKDWSEFPHMAYRQHTQRPPIRCVIELPQDHAAELLKALPENLRSIIAR